MKYPKTSLILFFITISIIILYLLYRYRKPSIDDIWFINLDRDVERYNFYMSMANRLPLRANRWPGTDGKKEERHTALLDGVSTGLSISMDKEANSKSSKVLTHPGVIGCWLSHKRLLKHLNTLNVPDHYGHLIMEDDIIIPENFNERWPSIQNEIPYNWDIVYFFTGKTYGKRISKNVLQWKNDKIRANWGTQTYLVRHGALPFMLSKLKYMDSPIDCQYYRHFGSLNVYILDPPLIQHSDMESTILNMNKENID
jgi:GR25 family glycosyltransferase involved in LPS biosynthesis